MVDEPDFQRRRTLMVKHAEDSELQKRLEKDEKIAETLERFDRENSSILDRARERREAREERQRLYEEKRLERQKRHEQEMEQVKLRTSGGISTTGDQNGNSLEQSVTLPEVFGTTSKTKTDQSPSKLKGQDMVDGDVEEDEVLERERERERLKEEALQKRVPVLSITPKTGKRELKELAMDLHDALLDTEEDIYDFKIRIQKQNYEIKELRSRIKEIRRRKKSSELKNTEDSSHLLEQLIARDADSLSSLPSIGSRVSITTIGGVQGRVDQFRKLSDTKQPEKKTLLRQTSTKSVMETVKAIQNFIDENSIRCKSCEDEIFHAERVMIGNSAYHRECIACHRCSRTIPPSEVGFWGDKMFCPAHLKKVTFADLPREMSGRKTSRVKMTNGHVDLEDDN